MRKELTRRSDAGETDGEVESAEAAQLTMHAVQIELAHLAQATWAVEEQLGAARRRIADRDAAVGASEKALQVGLSGGYVY